MRQRSVPTCIGLVLLAALPAAAHPGHGNPATAGTPLHYVVEWPHAVGLLAGEAVVMLLALARRRRREPRP